MVLYSHRYPPTTRDQVGYVANVVLQLAWASAARPIWGIWILVRAVAMVSYIGSNCDIEFFAPHLVETLDVTLRAELPFSKLLQDVA